MHVEEGREDIVYEPLSVRLRESAKFAILETVVGVQVGMSTGMFYGFFSAHSIITRAKKTHEIVMDVQREMNPTTTFATEKQMNHYYAEWKDNIIKTKMNPAFNDPIFIGAAMGGCVGALFGVARIFRAVFYPVPLRNE